MIFGLMASILTAITCGFLLTSVCLPWNRKDLFPIPLKGLISIGTGFGIFSVLLFLSLAFITFSKSLFLITDLSFLAALAIFACFRSRTTNKENGCRCNFTASIENRVNTYISIAFFAALIFSVITFIYLLALNPHGGWDACAIWNLRARLIFRSGLDWERAFSTLLGWDHPDYPLLIPLSIVRIWMYIGGETVAGPSLISGLFTVATVGLLVCALRICRGKNQGYLGGLVLLGIPFFIRLGADQYADVPLAFFFLATVILCYFYLTYARQKPSILVMAGITGSLAAWTKNEGLLFVMIVLVVFFITRIKLNERRDTAKGLAFLALGALPILLAIVYFKLMIAPENDLIDRSSIESLKGRITDLSRYTTVLFFFISRVWDLREWNVFPLLLMGYFMVMKSSVTKRNYVEVLFPVLTVVLMGAGYFFVYIAMSENLVWHLETSFNRLMIQLTPTVLFTFFLIVRTVDEAVVTKNISIAGQPLNNKHKLKG